MVQEHQVRIVQRHFEPSFLLIYHLVPEPLQRPAPQMVVPAPQPAQHPVPQPLRQSTSSEDPMNVEKVDSKQDERRTTTNPALQPPPHPVPQPLPQPPPSKDPLGVDPANSKKRERRSKGYKSKKYVEITDDELVKEESGDDVVPTMASVRPLHEPSRRRQQRHAPKAPPPIQHGGVVPPVGHPMRKELLTCDCCRSRNIVRASEDADLPAAKRRPLFECERPDSGGCSACSNCRKWKAKCSRVPVSWGRSREQLSEAVELEWKVSGIEPPVPQPRRRERRRRASGGDRERQRSSRGDSGAQGSEAEKVIVVAKGKQEKGKERASKVEKGGKRGWSEIAGNGADEDDGGKDENLGERTPAKRQRRLSPPPVTGQAGRIVIRPAKQHPAEAGPSTKTRWIEKSDGAVGRKITISRDPPPSTLDRMGSRQDGIDARLSAVERAVAGTNEMQREVIKAMSEMSENLSRISIQVAPSVQAAPAMQVATDLQLNGYARRMHRIEAVLQGLTTGLESNRQEIDSVNRRLNNSRNDTSPAGPSGSEGAPMQVMDMDIDLFLHSEAMENGRGTEPAAAQPVIGDRVNRGIQVDLGPTPFQIFVTNATPPLSASLGESIENPVIEAGCLSSDDRQTASPPAEQPPPDLPSVQGSITHEVTVVTPVVPVDAGPDPVVPGLVAMPEGQDVDMPAESTPAAFEPQDALPTIVPDVPSPDGQLLCPAEADVQAPLSRQAIDASLPPWGDPMSPLSSFGTQESELPMAEETVKPAVRRSSRVKSMGL